MSGKPPSRTELTWVGGHAFEGGRPGGPTIVLDGDAQRGPSPVDTLLMALAACTGYDLVDIMEKRRTPLASLRIAVLGERFDGVPGRVTRVVLTYDVSGEGVERVHVERAVELAVTKYCSVRDSLDPNLPIETVIRVHEAAPSDA
jgi:putative redox protein